MNAPRYLLQPSLDREKYAAAQALFDEYAPKGLGEAASRRHYDGVIEAAITRNLLPSSWLSRTWWFEPPRVPTWLSTDPLATLFKGTGMTRLMGALIPIERESFAALCADLPGVLSAETIYALDPAHSPWWIYGSFPEFRLSSMRNTDRTRTIIPTGDDWSTALELVPPARRSDANEEVTRLWMPIYRIVAAEIWLRRNGDETRPELLRDAAILRLGYAPSERGLYMPDPLAKW